MVKEMVKENILGLRETSMWGNRRMGKEMAKEYILGLRETSMWGNSRTE